MAEVTAPAPVQLAAVADLLDGAEVRSVGPDSEGLVRVVADVDEDRLRGAVESHDPTPPTRTPVPSLADKVATLEAEVRGIRERAEQAATASSNADAKAVGQAVAGPRN